MNPGFLELTSGLAIFAVAGMLYGVVRYFRAVLR